MKVNYSEFTVVLPTINERRTIKELIGYILRNYRGCSIIVADDGSTDGTKNIVREISKGNSRVVLLDRRALGLERGLTYSVVDGIRRSKTKYVVVMDADMQHPPGKIKDIAKSLTEGNNLVVAERVSIPDWALYRRIISRSMMFLGKTLLYIDARETCVDIFSGFFGIERSIFVKTYEENRKRFVGHGYKVLYDFLKCIDRGKLLIDNVPFVFSSREFGTSKAGVRQGLALFKSFVS